ncbi:hypothetical protein V2G26_016279 [Clonostachys chloroleuca]
MSQLIMGSIFLPLAPLIRALWADCFVLPSPEEGSSGLSTASPAGLEFFFSHLTTALTRIEPLTPSPKYYRTSSDNIPPPAR